MSAQEAYVALNATNFPDSYFRTYLQTKFSSNVKTENGVTYIDRTAITEINLNLSDGKLNNTQIYYTKIASLQGIKLFVNLQTLGLPAISKTATYSLKDIDVSDMPYLTKITNYSSSYQLSVPANSGGGASGTWTPATKFSISITKINADNCPNLTEVQLSGYKNLRSISLAGTTGPKLEKLYLLYSGILRLDVSNLPAINNYYMQTSSIDRYWTDYAGIANSFDAMNVYSHFSVKGCADLTELTIGEHPWKMLDISYCPKLESIDISGLPTLVRFCASFSHTTGGQNYSSNDASTHYNCNHQYVRVPGAALKEVKLGQSHDWLRVFNCEGASLTSNSVDFAKIAPTVILLNVSYNQLRSFDLTPFTKVTYLDLGYNRIHHLDLPPNKSIYSMSISDNCLTRMDQFKPDGKLVYSSLPTGGRTNCFQYIRVGKAYRYKVLNDASEAQYVETADDTGTQKYFWAINGGHMGNPDNQERIFGGDLTGRMEDPCYFYFDSPLTDGQYWYRNPYAKADHFQHDWFKVTLCHSIDLDFDPDQTFYLAGDFNNWQPTPEHAFVYNPETEHYECLLSSDQELRGTFRMWNAMDISKVSVDLGGHNEEKPVYNGHDNHIFFAPMVHHSMSNDATVHYSTFKTGEDDNTGGGYRSPNVEMKLQPGNAAGNYVRILSGEATGVNTPDADTDSQAQAEMYDLNGMRISTRTPAPGIYIRKQGRKVTKIIIK